MDSKNINSYIVALEDANKKLGEENKRLKESQSPDIAYVKELESRLQERDKKISELNNKSSVYKIALENLIKSIRETETENDDKLDKYDEVIRENKQLKNTILAYKTENNLLKSKLERLNNPKSLMELYYETIWQILS